MTFALRARRLLGVLVVACAALAVAPAPAEAATGTSVTLPSGRKYTISVEQRGVAYSAVPTVVLLHGLYNTSATVQKQSGFDHVGRLRRWNVVYGEGYGAWNAGTCCGSAVTKRTDDVGYLRDVARHLRTRGHYGPVYLAGFSNGGMMAMRAACAYPTIFRRVGSVGGPLVAPCSTSKIAARHLHGFSDTVVPYRGGWSAFCKVTFPDSRTEYQRVGAGSDYKLVGFSGGHSWPPTATAYLRDFFARGTSAVVVNGTGIADQMG